MMAVFILRIFGLFLIIFILVFAGKLWVGLSKMEKEIAAEEGDPGKDEI